MLVFQAIDQSFAIHSSVFVGDVSYTFWDAKKEDLLRDRRDNSIVYFSTIQDALDSKNGMKLAPAILTDAAEVTSSKRKGKSPNPESALGVMRRLITENTLSDEEILAEVQKLASGYKHVSIVKYTRNKMGL